MSHQQIRDYVRGWAAYHSGPDADVPALTKAVCAQLRHNPNRSLTPFNRQELRQALGTKDAADARTLAEVTRAVLDDCLEETCAPATARAVAETILSVYQTGWDLRATTRLPRALAAAHEELLRAELTPRRARDLVQAHAARSPVGPSGAA